MTGKLVVFDSAGVAGLVDAVAASCAVPGGMAAFWWRRTAWPGAGRMPQLRGRLLVWPGDEEAQPSGPVLRDLRHLAGEVAAVWLDGMFIADEIVLDVGFPAAQARLVNLARRGGLSSASKAAYADELSAVIRVGPFGDAAGASKLVRVRFLDPVCRGDVMTLALRWEATGVTGALFPVLDADITLTPAGHQATRLALAGSYRAPLGGLGAGLDKAILNRVATATIRALLRNVADSLASPGMTAARQAEPASGPAPWPYIPPEMPWYPARHHAFAGGTFLVMSCHLAANWHGSHRCRGDRVSEMPATAAWAVDDGLRAAGPG